MSNYYKRNFILFTISIIAIIILYCILIDKANRYTVDATVYGHEGTETTLFETSDGNIWAYDLNDHLPVGKEVKLNMYDMADGKDITQNVILSVNIDGVDVTDNAN